MRAKGTLSKVESQVEHRCITGKITGKIAEVQAARELTHMRAQAARLCLRLWPPQCRIQQWSPGVVA